MGESKKTSWYMCFSTRRDRRNQNLIIGWGLAWSIAWVAVTWGLRSGWLPGGAPAVTAILLATGCGLGMVLAYRRFLREADELRRKIEIEALALAAGVGLVGGISYRLLQRAGAVGGFEPLDVVVLLISATYMLGVLLGYRRYA